MNVSKDKVVAVSYELHVEGKLADKAESSAPLEYIHGTGMLLPKFEAALEGKEPGDAFAFTLTPQEGYGEFNPAALVRLSLDAFKMEGRLMTEFLVVGRTLPMLNGEGQVVQGTITEIGEDHVVMDFNHPMAGKTLDFTGHIESVREASARELAEGLHGEYLPPEEGCHKGKCHKHEGEGCHKHEGEGCHKHEGEGCHKHEGEGCCKDKGEGDCGCQGNCDCK